MTKPVGGGKHTQGLTNWDQCQAKHTSTGHLHCTVQLLLVTMGLHLDEVLFCESDQAHINWTPTLFNYTESSTTVGYHGPPSWRGTVL